LKIIAIPAGYGEGKALREAGAIIKGLLKEG
jgi:hypothetical protein